MDKTGESAAMAHEMGHPMDMSMSAMVQDVRNRWIVAVLFAVPVFLYSPLFTSFFLLPSENIPTVFSPRLDVNTRSFSFETKAPATPGKAWNRMEILVSVGVNQVDRVVVVCAT